MDILSLLSDPAAWLALLTLIALEVVLGIDNLIFIAILSNKLPEHQQQRARRIGLSLALVMRIGMLMLIGWLVTLQTPLFDLGIQGAPNDYGEPSFDTAFSGRDLILLVGGLFLLWKATKEIHHSMEPEDDSGDLLDKTPDKTPTVGDAVKASFGTVIAQIVAIDLVFSVDSILTAVGMTDDIPIMVAAVVITVAIIATAEVVRALRCRSPGALHREEPDAGYARARLPRNDRRRADRGRVRFPRAQGLYLRRDGLLGRGRNPQHRPA